MRHKVDKALALRNEAKYEEAILILKDLLIENQDSPVVWGLLSAMYFETHKWSEATHCALRCTELNPRAELASVTLFHSLWKQGRHEDAFAEMHRFTSRYDSEEYSKLTNDMKVEIDTWDGQIGR